MSSAVALCTELSQLACLMYWQLNWLQRAKLQWLLGPNVSGIPGLQTLWSLSPSCACRSLFANDCQ